MVRIVNRQKEKARKLRSTPCAEVAPSPVIICPEAHNHFQIHKNRSEPAVELCTELFSELYYALILNVVCGIRLRDSSVLYCQILRVKVNDQHRGKAIEGALGLDSQTEVGFLRWLRAGLVREYHRGQPSTSSPPSSSSLCLVFAFFRKRDLVGYC